MFVNLPVIYVLDNTGWTAKLRNDHNFFGGIFGGAGGQRRIEDEDEGRARSFRRSFRQGLRRRRLKLLQTYANQLFLAPSVIEAIGEGRVGPYPEWQDLGPGIGLEFLRAGWRTDQFAFLRQD